MKESIQLVVFTVDEQRYGLDLGAVERVVPAVQITPLPAAPQIALGVINLQGRVIPVLDIRNRFGLRQREIDLSDQFIIARTARRTVALVADAVTGVVERRDDEIMDVEQILPGTQYVEGLVKLADGLVLIHDLDTFLSLEEDTALEEAVQEA